MNERRYFLSRDGETWVEVTEEDWFNHPPRGASSWVGFGLPPGKVIELIPMPEKLVQLVSFSQTWALLQETLSDVQVAVDRGEPHSPPTADVAALMERLVLSWPPTPEDVGEAAGYLMMLLAERNHLKGLISSEFD
jgi:hypothetical protein